MAARSLGSLTVDLILKASGFAEGWTAAERDADKAQRKMSAKAKQSAKEVSDAWNGAASLIGASFAGISAGVVLNEMVSLAKETSAAAAEVEKFSQLSNTSTKDFQRLAAGATTVGVSAEKMADIFKDVQDKVGDFIQTGGGGMADFFERVAPQIGVTAEQFRKLSGPDALQLYVSSLEKANLSQSDMVFFMEALASDSANLIPLLKDNGKAWQELGDRAEAYGAILSTDTLAAARDFKTETENLELSMKGLRYELVEGVLPSMTQFTQVLASPETREALADLAGWLGQITVAAVEMSTVIGKSGFWSWLQVGDTTPAEAAAEIAKIELQMQKVREIRDAIEAKGGGWLHAEDIAVANSQLSTMEAKLRGLQVMAQQYQVQQAAALRTMARGAGLGWLESYVPEAERPNSKLSPAFTKPAPKASGGKSQADKDREAAEKYVLALREQAEAVKALSATEKLAYDLSEKKIKLTATQTEQARAYAETIEQQIARQKAAVEFEKEMARVTADADTNARLREEIVLIGKSEDQLYEIQRLRVEETLLIKQQHAAELDRLSTTDAGWSRQRANLESEIQLLEERLGLMDSGRTRQKSADSWKAQQEQGQKAMDSIVQSFTDGLINGTQSFAQLLKNTVFTVAVRPLAEGVIGNLTGTGSGGGIGDTVGQLGNLYKMSQSALFQDFGSAVAGNIQQAGGQLFSKGFETVGAKVVDFGNTVAGVSDAINVAGDIFGYGKAIYDLSQGKYGSAIGTAIGTAVGGPIGAAIGGTLGGWVDSAFGSDRPSSERIGGSFSTTGETGVALADAMGLRDDLRSAVTKRESEGITKAVTDMTTSVLSLVNSVSQYSGRTYGGSFAFADEPSLDDRASWGAFRILDQITGELLNQWNSGKDLAADAGEAFTASSSTFVAALVEQLQASDLPGWVADQINTLRPTGTENQVLATDLQRVMESIAATGQAFDALGRTMAPFADLTDDTRTALVRASGGIQGLTTNASAYYEAYYSEAERVAASRDQLLQALGSIGVESLDPRIGEAAKIQFRDAVETALASGKGELAAQLMSLGPVFSAAADAAHKASEGFRSQLQERKSLDAEMLRASGNTRDYELALRDLAVEGYTAAEKAAWGNNRALEAQIAAMDRMRETIASFADSMVNSLDSLKDAAKDLFGFADELIYGDLSGLGGAEKVAALETQYRDVAARAEMGDEEAMRLLPQATTAFLQATQQMSGSARAYTLAVRETASDLRGVAEEGVSTRERNLALIYESLSKNLAGMPAYSAGTPYVPETGLALIHEGEMIVPKAYNPNAGGSFPSASASAQEDNRVGTTAVVTSLNQILRIVRQWNGDGLPQPREE